MATAAETGVMAKGRPKQPGKKTKSILVLKGTVEWELWLKRYAAERRMPVPVLIDQALAEHARKYGFEPPPER